MSSFAEAAAAAASSSGVAAASGVGRLPRRDTSSTPWLTDLVWATARRLGYGANFLDEPLPVEDDHMHFLKASVPAVDLIDLDFPEWHTAGDTLDKVSARSLQIVGDVVLAALPEIEARLIK